VKRTDWNSIVLAITIVVFIIIVILSTKASTKDVEDDMNIDDVTVSSDSIFQLIPMMKVNSGPELTITAGDASRSTLFVGPMIEIMSKPVLIWSESKPTVDTYHFDKIGYSTAKLNIRTHPNISSDIWDHYHFNDEIHYSEYDDAWVVVDWCGALGYVYKSYVSEDPLPYVSKSVQNDVRKSFEDYRCLSSTSRQGMLQTIADTSPSGLRKVDNRYCVAVGSYFSHDIGKYIDVVLQNGEVIPCIIADAKADAHTDSSNAISRDGSCVEFIVDTESLPEDVQASGDCSGCKSSWNSPVSEIRLYEYTSRITRL